MKTRTNPQPPQQWHPPPGGTLRVQQPLPLFRDTVPDSIYIYTAEGATQHKATHAPYKEADHDQA